jgi:hypothetical protein
MKKLFFVLAMSLLGLTATAQLKPTVILDNHYTPAGVDSLTFQSVTFRAIVVDTIGTGWNLNGKGFFFSVDSTFALLTGVQGGKINGNTPSGYGPYPNFYFAGRTTANQLVPNTTYYVKAFVKKSVGSADTSWSNVVSFTTPAAIPPSMTILPTSSIGLSNATLKGSIDSIYDDVRTWTKKGFIRSKTPNPTHATEDVVEHQIAGATPNNNNSNTPFAMSFNAVNLDTGGTYYARMFMILKFGSGNNDTIYSDQTSFVVRHPCDSRPFSVIVNQDSIMPTTAFVSWTRELGQKKFQIDCGIVGHTEGEGQFLQITTDTFMSITGLTPENSYSVYVRAVCTDTTFSDWSNVTPYTFFTTKPEICPPVTQIRTTELRTTSAIITWEKGSGSQWRWEYLFAKDAENYPEIPTLQKYNPEINPVGLTKNTDYKIRIRAICDQHDDVIDTLSEWSEDFVFHTPSVDSVGLYNISNNENPVKIFPNPTSSEINFDYGEGQEELQIKKIEIIDESGKIIATINRKITSYKFDKGRTGTFLVKIYTDKGLQSKKIIVE